uniref:Uncharacterized protein n=1 Tax=Brassica campestris TaxID=3711 RepID=M4ECD3_BRACM|nr:unnamed protein product [Brassica rapa]
MNSYKDTVEEIKPDELGGKTPASDCSWDPGRVYCGVDRSRCKADGLGDDTGSGGKPGKDKLRTSQERASKEERSDAGSQQTKYSDH